MVWLVPRTNWAAEEPNWLRELLDGPNNAMLGAGLYNGVLESVEASVTLYFCNPQTLILSVPFCF